VALDRDLIDAVRDLDEHELRRLFILARARLEAAGVPIVSDHPSFRLRQRMVRCGKDGCTACPHGPYWYAFWRENGRRRSRYVGKLLDEAEV
jgi:hypothetical protein